MAWHETKQAITLTNADQFIETDTHHWVSVG